MGCITTMTHCIFYSEEMSNVTLPEWLTGSPANKQIKRLGFARECSNRSGDDFLSRFFYIPNWTRLDLAFVTSIPLRLESSMSANKYSNLPDIVRVSFCRSRRL
jgi:hypothetical protein